MMMSDQRERLKWFRDAKFGMFIHWGLYSIPARHEWLMRCEKIPVEEYEKYAREFNPKNFKIEDWVCLARDAGMKYMVLTTRHHDGFSLFDSKVSDFTSAKTAARRDFVAEYVSACRKVGMRIGLYYSLMDWRWPAARNGPGK
ncbi:MAG: alpha-L-fucosidase, partial [SAR324 cluster bacterium]|nr:alpha-L-fucosidase [SAR324 cluster bacterium]